MRSTSLTVTFSFVSWARVPGVTNNIARQAATAEAARVFAQRLNLMESPLGDPAQPQALLYTAWKLRGAPGLAEEPSGEG